MEPPTEVLFTFDKAVVPLGRMDRSAKEIAITFTPSLNCEWRWVSPNALACKLSERDHPQLATTYAVTVPEKFDSTTTITLRAPHSGTFTTPRPTITSAWWKTWSSPVMPVVQIAVNQPVIQTSLPSHLYFEDAQKRRYPIVAAEVTPNSDEQESSGDARRDAGRHWLIAPERDLPANTAVTLRITPGLTAVHGDASGREDREINSFHTFSEFQFIGVTCRDLKGTPFLIKPDQRATSRRCDPLNAIQLTFNAPISKEHVTPAIRSVPDLRGGRADFDPWESTPSYSQRDGEHIRDQQYYLNLPYGLKANTTYTFSAQAIGVRDDFDRPLSRDLGISFTTDNRSPRFVLDNRHSVLEKETDSKLPVVVNNIETLSLRYQALTTQSLRNDLSTIITPYKASNVAYPFPIDIRGLLGGRSGVIQGALSAKPPQKYDNVQRFFSQVTPYAVHAKVGHFSSLVWVTSLSTGEPVANAKVSVLVDTTTKLSPNPQVLTAATTDQFGIATLPGTASLDPNLTYIDQWDEGKPRLLIRVDKESEMALVPLSWDYQVYDNDVYPYTRAKYGHIHTWGTTAQGLYRLGDTVQFSLWVRDQNNERFIPAPRDSYSLHVKDPTDKVIFQVPQLTLSEFGSYAGEFTTSPSAAVGWYTFALKANFSEETWEPLRVLISDFSPAPFTVTSELQGSLFRPSDRVSLRTEARLHAGGPYADAPVRITARLASAPLTLPDPTTKGFTFSCPATDQIVYQREARLDEKGDLVETFNLFGSDLPHGELILESAVRDDRGTFVASLAKARYVGRSRFVGIAQDDWILSAGKSAVVRALVVSEDGTRTQGDKVSLRVEYEDTKVARVKSAGNAYTNRYENTWIAVHSCELISNTEVVSCNFTPTKPGRYRFTASVRDALGREHSSSIERWGSGSGELVWQTGTNNQLQIIPERTSYKVGETARFMLQNPFPTAQALLTVERYGVQRSWNQTISDPSSIIEVPVTHEHIPGFFFSATLMSPRVAKPIEGSVDLGKPTFRMGYAQIAVEDPAQRLGVTVSTAKTTLKPHEQVTVDLALTSGTPYPSEVQFAVTVIDEAVFDLISSGRAYFDPYRGFYSLDGLDVKNYNLLKMLLGRQNFEKKGANPGGDGASKLDMRSIEKYVAYWNPAIRSDTSGRASFSFEAPNNLTGWRVFALALTKEDRMGLGEGRFIVNKDTEVRSAIPNQVRRGDTFNAVFTVINRSAAPRTLSVEAQGEGDSVAVTAQKLSVYAEPFKRYPIAITAKALKAGTSYLTVKAFDAVGGDALRAPLTILPRTIVQTAASFGSSLNTQVAQPVQVPSEIDPDQGSIGAVVSSSLLGGLSGAFEYMRDYPYECWEQKLSKALMAAYSVELRRFLPKSFVWPGAQDLVSQTLAQASQHQAPSGGMTFYTPTDDHVSPYLSAFTALGLTWLRDLGYSIPETMQRNLHLYLENLLRKDTFDEAWSGQMKLAVRAVALAALAQTGAASATDVQRLAPRASEIGLFGKANYLRAAIALGSAAKRVQDDITRQLLAASSESSGTFTLLESRSRLSPWLLDSAMRSQCAALDAFLAASSTSKGSMATQLAAASEKLVRSIAIDQKRKDRWNNTQENVFCVHALAHYAKLFESDSSDLDISVRIGQEQLATLAMKRSSNEPLEVSRPIRSTDRGAATTVTLTPGGHGRFYYSTRLTYAPQELPALPTNAGLEITREFAVQRNGVWSEVKAPVTVRQGELVTVNLFLRLSTPRHYVVVSDPIPGGLEPVNRDLATASTVDTPREGFTGPTTSLWFTQPGWIDSNGSGQGFYHRELRHSAARFYSEFLPPGNYHLSYVAQAIAPGEFAIPPTHAEMMYDPDIFGESGSDMLKVE